MTVLDYDIRTETSRPIRMGVVSLIVAIFLGTIALAALGGYWMGYERAHSATSAEYRWEMQKMQQALEKRIREQD